MSCALALYECTFYAEACSSSDEFDSFGIKLLNVCNDLYVLNRAAIVEGYKVDRLTAAAGTYPTFNAYFDTIVSAAEYVYNLCSFYK